MIYKKIFPERFLTVFSQNNPEASGRNFGSPQASPARTTRLSTCQLSPISTSDTQLAESDRSPIARARKSKSVRLDFSGHMSVDTSFNMAPENDPQTSPESPLRINEYMENSCNWDMEYNNLSLNGKSIRKSLFANDSPERDARMDVSHHPTPKSKKPVNQRKKLSESFRLFESESEGDDDDCSNLSKRLHVDNDRKSNVDVLSQNTQDTGYNTCTELSQRESRHEDEMVISDVSSYIDKENVWNTNIFASTPTKRAGKNY